MNNAELMEISDFIYLLADAAKKITMNGFKSSANIKKKIDGSPVTEFDINAEKVIINLIKKKFPNHNIIAEENESTILESDYTWIIDPIDGTRSYIIGRPLWGTLIGLAFKGEPLIGLVDFPALNERWLGFMSSCFFNKSIFLPKKSKLSNLSEATIASTDPDFFSDDGKQKFQDLLEITLRNVWSGDCHNYLLLCNGGLDLVVEEGLSSYDIIPLVPILKSLGLIITDWKGNELSLLSNKKSTFSTLASNNKYLHQAALSILK
jgi:histidinol phosphatase-like enzyme (inositol monophosphatase family)